MLRAAPSGIAGDEAGPARGGRGLGAAGGAELGQNVRYVHAGGLGRDESSAAMSRLLRPAATRRRTSIPRAVRPKIPGAGAGTARREARGGRAWPAIRSARITGRRR